jgi:hypothetical protein
MTSKKLTAVAMAAKRERRSVAKIYFILLDCAYIVDSVPV